MFYVNSVLIKVNNEAKFIEKFATNRKTPYLCKRKVYLITFFPFLGENIFKI